MCMHALCHFDFPFFDPKAILLIYSNVYSAILILSRSPKAIDHRLTYMYSESACLAEGKGGTNVAGCML